MQHLLTPAHLPAVPLPGVDVSNPLPASLQDTCIVEDALTFPQATGLNNPPTSTFLTLDSLKQFRALTTQLTDFLAEVRLP